MPFVVPAHLALNSHFKSAGAIKWRRIPPQTPIEIIELIQKKQHPTHETTPELDAKLARPQGRRGRGKSLPNAGMRAPNLGQADFLVIRRGEERLAILEVRRNLDRIGLANFPGASALRLF